MKRTAAAGAVLVLALAGGVLGLRSATSDVAATTPQPSPTRSINPAVAAVLAGATLSPAPSTAGASAAPGTTAAPGAAQTVAPVSTAAATLQPTNVPTPARTPTPPTPVPTCSPHNSVSPASGPAGTIFTATFTCLIPNTVYYQKNAANGAKTMLGDHLSPSSPWKASADGTVIYNARTTACRPGLVYCESPGTYWFAIGTVTGPALFQIAFTVTAP